MKKMIKRTFNNDPEKFVYFAEKGSLVPTGDEEISLEEAKEDLKAIGKIEFDKQQYLAKIKQDEHLALLGNKKPPKIQNLLGAFSDPEKWQRMMNYLVLKDLLAEHTYLFKDNAKGKLNMAVDLLNTLEMKGYFHRNLYAIEKRYILYNMGLSVTLDHIKRPPKPTGCMMKVKPYDISIQPASTW